MLILASRLVSIMLAFLLGFASIKAEVIPEGVMPKRAVVGTGVSTTSAASSTTSQAGATSKTPVTSNTPQSTSSQANPTTSNTPAGSSAQSATSKGDTTPQQSASQAQSSTSIPTTIAVTTKNSDGSTITSKITTHTLAAVSSSNTGPVQTESGSKNSVVKIGSKTIDPATLSHKTTVKKPLVAQETRHSTYTSFWTSNGQVYSSVYTTENVFASTTGFATATIAPSLANGGGNGSNLSTHTKAIIGGVVGGIGGAILIGGLAFVAWRLWGKKKRQADMQDDYVDSQNDSIRKEERASTLASGGDGTERYQNPGGSVNTASNF